MPDSVFAENSLVLYKGHPARVIRAGEKLELEIQGGETARVRPKDVSWLHPGPVRSFAELKPQTGEVVAAWEILAGSQTTLPELADLVYAQFTPATAWATWQLVAEGLYFRGTPEAIAAASTEELANRQAARAADVAEREAWLFFVAHAQAHSFAPEDVRYLREIEAVALRQATRSRVLQMLGREELAESAHAWLLDTGYWSPFVNPYPARLGLPPAEPDLPVHDLPIEDRLDLTHLPAFAIDDARTDTPDDALSYDGQRLWVHVADVAALVPPDSPIDLEARARGATSYLPEVQISMVPRPAIRCLGLGLDERSPALSFGIDCAPDGQMLSLQVAATWLRVTRLTYEQVEEQLDRPPFAALYTLAQANRARRIAQGAIQLELPEVDLAVDAASGDVRLLPVERLRSRLLVEEAMIMAGEAAARYALESAIPLPYATQEVTETPQPATTLSGMFALRRTLKSRQYRSAPGRHGGLGLDAYAQVTSPLRRYLDMVAHQQLRAHALGQPVLDLQELVERVGATEAVMGSVRQAERLSNTHWRLVYLMQHPHWRGEGILVSSRGLSGTVMIPELGYEAQVHLPGELALDSTVRLSLTKVDLPRLDAHFRVE